MIEDSLPTLVIGNKNYSSWSLRPWLLMRHFGIAFTEVKLPLDTVEFHERIVGLSPNARVPALHVDGDVVWDSLAICETVSERWLNGAGWPAERRVRAAARSASAEMHSGLSSLRSQLPMNCRRQPGAPHWDAAAGRDIQRVEELWRFLRGSFAGEAAFLCGGFGIVDAMFAPVCLRFRSYAPVLAADTLAYMERVLALAAMGEWLADAALETARVAADEA